MDKLYSAVSYSDIYANTDLRYDLQSNQLKESVIIKQAKDTLAGYKYTLSAPGMVLELQEDNTIFAYAADAEEGDEPIFYMPAPFLVDDNRAYNDNITISLQQNGDTYTLTYSLPRTWLLEEERAYPVVLDPVVQPKSGIYTISDQTVFSNKSMSYTWACLGVGHSTTYKSIARALLKFDNLPVLTSADVIVDSQIYVQKCNSSSSAPMEVHAIKIPWESSTVKWTDMSARNKNGNWDTTVEDYQLVSSSGTYAWDVTNIAQQWYASGVNTGMLFCLPEDLENSSSNTFREFYSSDWGGSRVPQLTITYLNNCGLEDYWDYTSQSAGRAGTGYVSNFTGNLVWIHNGLSFSGNRMPVSISHVYNANDKSNNDYGLGYGWRTNYNQRVYSWTSPGNNPTTYYVWEDQDGTRKYFKYSSSGKYENEIDNTLVLTTTGSGNEKYCITDKNGNKSYFDAAGRLKKICNNQQTVSSIAIDYSGSTDFITSVTDGVGRVYKFNYNLEDLLGSIEFMGTESDPITTLTYTYDSSSNLIGITYPDNQSVAYGYTTNHLLTSVTDVGGYKVTYDYNVTSTKEPNRVVEIKELDGTTEGGHLEIEYAHNQTTFKDHNGNKEIVQFNKFGSTVSIQDGLGRAQFAQYASNTEINEASQLTLSSKLQSTVVNLLQNTEDDWVDGEDCNNSPCNITFNEWDPYFAGPTIGFHARALDYYGLELDSSARPDILPGRTYTFSCYMSADSDSGFVYWRIGNNSIAIPLTQTPVSNSNWVKISATYTHPQDSAPTTANIFLGQDGSGITVFSDLQLVESTSLERYNLVSNSDFRNGTDEWVKNSSCTSADTVYVPTEDAAPEDIIASAAPQLDTSYYQIIGSATAAKTVSQTITLSGSEDDVFTLAGWGKGDSVPLSGDRKFGIAVTFIDSDGTAGEEHLLSFNPDSDSENNWQYAATRVIADKAYSSVRVDLLYCNNQNTAYFDGIQLYKEEFGQSYVYDEETGMIESVIDLQQQRTEYKYSGTNLTEMLLPNGAHLNYSYDQYNNVTGVSTAEGLTYELWYDTYGNNTYVTVGDSGDRLSATATYTSDGNLLATVTDQMGETTVYGYNTQTGVLEWVQLPGENQNTRTEYTYDSLYRTTKVDQADASVSYTYTTDLLDTITSASGTVYDFTYGAFDLVQSVKAGSHTLISHEYNASPNFYLTKSTYGNGDNISYTYDDYGRTTSKTYEDGDKVSYTYDNNGNLGLVTDSATGRTTKYLYDFQDRLARYEETGTNYSNSVEWEYDVDNNLSAQTQIINGTTYTSTYSYDDDNRLTENTQGDSAFYYDYGDLTGVLTGIDVTYFSSPVMSYVPEYTVPSVDLSSSQVSAWNYLDGNGSVFMRDEYLYDQKGNITGITTTDGENNALSALSYSYDSHGQLIRVNDSRTGKTWVYAYDNGGNITSRSEYDYVDPSDEPTSDKWRGTVSYEYDDTDGWADLLTEYNEVELDYDEIGNLTGDDTWTYTWEHGRQLAQMTRKDQTGSISYTYNADGMRISKNVNGTVYSYHYLGDQLVEMTWGSNKMSFIYNILGPAAVIYNDTPYYYLVNAQGDVVAITNDSGGVVVEYAYDAWGALVSVTGDMATTLGEINPLRYRGYVYDTETSLYYLQSRYYNPEWGRFISADEYVSTGQGLLGNNMFAYCNNNPVIFADEDGEWGVALALGASAAICSIGGDILSAHLSGEPINWLGTLGKAALTGIYTGLSTYAVAYDATLKLLFKIIDAGYAFFGSWISSGDIFAAMTSLGCWFASDLLGSWCNVDDSALEQLFEGFVTDAFGVAAEVPQAYIEEAVEKKDATCVKIYTGVSHSDPEYSDPNWVPGVIPTYKPRRMVM